MKFNISEVKKLFENNINIMKYVRELDASKKNSTEAVLLSYDLQAGSYIKIVEKNLEFTRNYSLGVAKIIDSLGLNNISLMEIGVGEATTLSHVVNQMKTGVRDIFGLDISWSRIKFAKEYYSKINSGKQEHLAVGDIFAMPFSDSSIDVVYSSHSLEPNGGREEEALREVYRVAKNYIVLLEPSFANADEEGKKRMTSNGYVKDLASYAKRLGYNVIAQYPYEHQANKNNPTEVIIIEKTKGNSNLGTESTFSCPLSKKQLIPVSGGFFCKESYFSYPIILGVPCLTPDHAILTSKMEEFFKE